MIEVGRPSCLVEHHINRCLRSPWQLERWKHCATNINRAMAVRPSSSLVPVSHGEVIEFMKTLNGEAHETLVFRGQQRSNAL